MDGWIRLSVVARNADGDVLFAATRRVQAHWIAEVAEAEAIDMAARLGKRYGLLRCLCRRIFPIPSYPLLITIRQYKSSGCISFPLIVCSL